MGRKSLALIMTFKPENKLSMYLAVQSVCDRNRVVCQPLKAFADTVTSRSKHRRASKGASAGATETFEETWKKVLR